MAGLCKATIVGNLGADPEQRFTQDGRSMAKFRVAVSNNKRDREGNRQEITEWFSITVFGKQAEIVGSLLRKGSRVYVDGRMEVSRWQGNDGQPRTTLEIIASDVISLDGRPRDTDAGAGDDAGFSDERPVPAPGGRGGRSAPPAAEGDDFEDLPF
ncbi:MAG: single-stranded DNA-binding protein [Chloroflexi bacterium]|nr:single-stranded DNA-binding protein [Chloroflexota bacterium]